MTSMTLVADGLEGDEVEGEGGAMRMGVPVEEEGEESWS